MSEEREWGECCRKWERVRGERVGSKRREWRQEKRKWGISSGRELGVREERVGR